MQYTKGEKINYFRMAKPGAGRYTAFFEKSISPLRAQIRVELSPGVIVKRSVPWDQIERERPPTTERMTSMSEARFAGPVFGHRY